MAVYVVTWNLNREVNYTAKRTAFLNHLNLHDNVADPALESVRWISTNLSAHDLCTNLRLRLDQNDRIFVARIADGSYSGFIATSTINWINQRL
ncbi:hypothetical protein JAK53_10715 [Stenotrophomonas maltophilia]|uniref:hypothetical protein n=1 Tax=Stenotrophomonas TaxID=40323 RepID=UPI0018D33805|nr:hypothetical protein [Stenotrophomonas maltophilia]MBH1816788.1 hypothetical protein [Stenotrophomonas maltophilia]MCU1029751.1 hypothetical protein [Stenotrophomonas maltophilia]